MLADTDLKGTVREVLLECYLIPTAEAESDEDMCGLSGRLFDPPTLNTWHRYWSLLLLAQSPQRML
jgi:hypothetical protein